LSSTTYKNEYLSNNNILMDEYDSAIESAWEEVEQHRSVMSVAKAKYALDKLKIIIGCKMDKKSDKWADAEAEVGSVDSYNAYLIAENLYKLSINRLNGLLGRKDSLKEKNFNERAAMKVFGG